MRHEIFAVYDEKAKAFLPPFFLPEIGMAKRVFGDCVNSSDHQFGKHPSDYTLFHMGEWLDHEGQILPFESRRSLGNGVEYKQQPEDSDQFDLVDGINAGGTD